MLTRISPPARVVLGVTLSLALVLARGTARADGGGGGGSPSMPSTPSSTFDTSQQQSPEEKAAQDKQHAQELYDQAYREVDKAKAELQEAADLHAKASANGANNASLAKKANDKADSARKRLEKSRDKFGDVTKLDAN